MLADRAGIELPEQDNVSREEREQEDLKSRILEVNKVAASYYYYLLRKPEGKLGLDYLLGRQLIHGDASEVWTRIFREDGT